MERVKADLDRAKLGVWLNLVRGAAPTASNTGLPLLWGGLSAELSQSRLALGAVLGLPPRVHTSERTEGSLKSITGKEKQDLGIFKAWASRWVSI